ncbi:hypothetical protein AAFX91_38005, partial [Bradyrhizobium sp. 31Argb]|uniref:hypothetical protein n=1 Tax=Bradyrhizobium sp. 31Argb TaxID=3141247 RepID=UPI0037485063
MPFASHDSAQELLEVMRAMRSREDFRGGEFVPRSSGLKRDDFSSNRHLALALCLSMIFFGKPVPTFPDHALGSVGIQDSHSCLAVIQALDGTIR